MELSITRLAPADAVEASELLKQTIGAQLAPQQLVRLALMREDAIAYGGYSGGRLAGVAVGEITDHRAASPFGVEARQALQGRRVGWIAQLAVQPDLRSQGVGRALLGPLLVWLAQRADTLASVAWVSAAPYQSAPILEAGGGRAVGRAPMCRIDPGRMCPECQPPCRCTGVLYVRDLTRADVTEWRRGRRWPKTGSQAG